MVEVGVAKPYTAGTFRPCHRCNPAAYEKWADGTFQSGGRDAPPLREMPADYHDQPVH